MRVSGKICTSEKCVCRAKALDDEEKQKQTQKTTQKQKQTKKVLGPFFLYVRFDVLANSLCEKKIERFQSHRRE